MRTLTGILLLAAVGAAAPYKSDKAPAKTARADLVKLGDLQLRITYPEGRAKCPVLLFSHGLWGSRRGYEPLATYWASNGYVCIQPDHPDSRALGRMERRDAMRHWKTRPQQVTLILDKLTEIEKLVPALKERLDKERIGMGGHSYGAHTAQLLAGVRPLGGRHKLADPRIKAFVWLSPQGEGGLFEKRSWEGVKPPVMVISGSRDASPLDPTHTGEWRLGAWRNLPAADGTRILVFVDGMHHGFGGISGVAWPGAGPRNDDQVRLTQQVSLAFFDAHVRGNSQAAEWLASGAAKKAYGLKLRYERK